MRTALIIATGAALSCAVILVLWQAGHWQAALQQRAACWGEPDRTREAIGWLASALTLVAFSMRRLIALRLVAMAGNLAFIAYGTLAGLTPVLALHLLLLPCNLFRLHQALTERQAPPQLDCGAPAIPTHDTVPRM